ncbi:MAG TPA: hypothetical protein VMV07_22165 [Streptosporangiaceae bacterium]|nr:hypothetical protein [Streptosporangiaceae bacterium]
MHQQDEAAPDEQPARRLWGLSGQLTSTATGTGSALSGHGAGPK